MMILQKVSMFQSKSLIKGLLVLTSLLTAPCAGALIDSGEVRVAAFFPTSKRFRDNFGSVGVNYQLEIAKNFGCNCSEQIWLGVDWYPKQGHLGSCGSSDLNILNGSVGYKHFWTCECFQFYGGIGPTFGWVWLENKRKCCKGCRTWKKKSDVFALGAVARLGAQYPLIDCLFIDLFVDYLYEVAFFHRNAYIGGFKTGLGLGYSF